MTSPAPVLPETRYLLLYNVKSAPAGVLGIELMGHLTAASWSLSQPL